MNCRFLALAVATATAFMAQSEIAFSKALVVRSAGPSAKAYPPGKALPDSAKISLQPGDSLTILGPGSKRTLRGPGTFTTASGDAQAMTGSKRARFGAMRTGDLSLNPSPWNLDVTQSGTICVGASGLQMWRPNSEEAAKLSISISGGPPTTVDWPAGKSTLAWPGAIKIADGSEYQLSLAGGSTSERVKFAVLPAIPEGVTDAAQTLIGRGCQNQLDVLVDGIEGE